MQAKSPLEESKQKGLSLPPRVKGGAAALMPCPRFVLKRAAKGWLLFRDDATLPPQGIGMLCMY